MPNPAVSIIIPAYNAQEYIRECLESILAQTFTNFEVIVVNDGSTDDTARIIAEYVRKDNRFRCITTANGGVSRARNTGMDNCNGEWISFVDADDCLFPYSIDQLLSVAVSSNTEIVSGQFSSKSVTGKLKKQNVSLFNPTELTASVLYQTLDNPSPWGKLYNRKVCQALRFTENMRYEDLDFFYRVYLRCNTIAVTDCPVYFYRKNPGSFINTFNAQRLDVLKVTAGIEHFARQQCPVLLKAARDRRLSANFNMFALLSIHDTENRYAEIKADCWNLIKKYRLSTLFNPKTRLKNKIGVLLSLFGKRIFIAVAKNIYS